MKAISSIQELIYFIGANSYNPSSTKSIAVEIKTLHNRIVRGIVRGSDYKGSKRPDAVSVRTSTSMDSNLLRSHVRNLLETGKSFIVRNGKIRDACPFEWTISDN